MQTRRTFFLGIGYLYNTNVVYKLSLPGNDCMCKKEPTVDIRN